jgi:spermidine synthase
VDPQDLRTAPPARSTWLPALSFASGAAALVYETLWLRWFRALFGSTAYAASAVLAAYFLGLALGAWLFARHAGRARRPLRSYAAIEVGVAATVLAVPAFLRLYDPVYAALYTSLSDSRGVFLALKFALAFGALLPPSLLLGATLPLLAAAYVRFASELGRRGGDLYAANTLGAAAGVAAGALWLPEQIGVSATYSGAAALSLAIGVVAFALSRRGSGTPAPAARSTCRRVGRPALAHLALAAGSGFGTLAFEVLLLHLLAVVLESSVYSFGAVLLVVLCALAAAAFVAAHGAARLGAERLLGGALCAVALLLLALPALVFATTLEFHFTAEATLQNGVLTAAIFGAPVLFVGGLVFPLTLHLAGGERPGERLGALLAANTLGGIAGSLAASFLLLDLLGSWRSLWLLGAAYGAAALCVHAPLRTRMMRAGAIAAVAATLALTGRSPVDLPVAVPEAGARVLAVRESASGVVSVIEEATGNRWLRIDNHYGLASSQGSTRQQRWGHLALLQHPDPKRVLFIGSATGGTAASAVPHPVRQIELVDIVPEVHPLAARFFAAWNRGVHGDPRTRLLVEDGRNHVRATPARYDVIFADLFVPWHPGAGSLYSREHFEAVRDHLAPRGVFAQWLPLYQLGRREFEIIVATFLDVFPQATLWRGDFSARTPTAGLIATRGAPLSAAELEARLATLRRDGGVDDRWLTDPRGFWMLYVGPLDPHAEPFASAPRTSDAHPRLEFVAGRGNSALRDEFAREIWPALAEAIQTASGPEDPLHPGRPLAGPRAGAALLRANLLATSGAPGARRQALAQLRREVPPDLLWPPDPTIGELWPAQPPATE